MSDFQHVPVDLSCKLFDTLLRPILLYNSEIWFMDDYMSVLRSIERSEKNGTSCDKLHLEEKFSYEKVHNKYCKAVLGLRKTACNLSTKAELGRFPIASFIKIQVMLYFARIQSSDINPLVKEALTVNKYLHECNIFSWYTFSTAICKEFEYDSYEGETQNRMFKKIKIPLKKKFKKMMEEGYSNQILRKLSTFNDQSKLHLYSQLKTEIKMEDYLILEKNAINRARLTKFRTSDHSLEIELGRYKNIPREQRLCKFCQVLDDESHFFLFCNNNRNPRTTLFASIMRVNPNFMQLETNEQLIYILNLQPELLTNICTFIKQSEEMRK